MKPIPSSSVSPYEREDEVLMNQVKSGDREAYAILYDRHIDRLRGYIARTLRDPQAGDELAQETFLRVYRSRDAYSNTGDRFTTWMWTIARRLTIDWLRKKKEWLSPSDEHQQHMVAGIEDEGIGAEGLFGQEVERRWLEECIDALPVNQRELFSLRTFSETPYEELREIVKRPVATIKTLVHRAKQSVIACVEGKAKGGTR